MNLEKLLFKVFTTSERALDFQQRAIETTIPFCCFLAQFFLVTNIANTPPGSIVAAFADPTTAFIWSVGALIAYVAILFGIWLRPGYLYNRVDTGLHLYFSSPGLIMGALLTMVYAVALMATFGALSTSVIAIASSWAIGLYFLFKWIRLTIFQKIAKSNLYREETT